MHWIQEAAEGSSFGGLLVSGVSWMIQLNEWRHWSSSTNHNNQPHKSAHDRCAFASCKSAILFPLVWKNIWIMRKQGLEWYSGSWKYSMLKPRSWHIRGSGLDQSPAPLDLRIIAWSAHVGRGASKGLLWHFVTKAARFPGVDLRAQSSNSCSRSTGSQMNNCSIA